jgi:hypothetical protein
MPESKNATHFKNVSLQRHKAIKSLPGAENNIKINKKNLSLDLPQEPTYFPSINWVGECPSSF